MLMEDLPKRIKPRRLGTILSVRLTPNLFEKLADKAAKDGITVSELVRQLVNSSVSQPIGYKCEHVNITGSVEIFKQPPTAGCGCRMLPVYDDEEFNVN